MFVHNKEYTTYSQAADQHLTDANIILKTPLKTLTSIAFITDTYFSKYSKKNKNKKREKRCEIIKLYCNKFQLHELQ